MSAAQKIIFLDIDGPVIPYKNQIAFSDLGVKVPADPVAVKLISLLVVRADAKIVISSQKRIQAKEKFLKEFIAWGFDPSLLHDDWRTPDLGKREKEIGAWIEKHPEVEKWIAIDDEALDLNELIMVCPANGFLITNYDDAKNALGIKGPKISDLFYWKARIGYEGPEEYKSEPATKRAIERAA